MSDCPLRIAPRAQDNSIEKYLRLEYLPRREFQQLR
jgi:hypothetical protein